MNPPPARSDGVPHGDWDADLRAVQAFVQEAGGALLLGDVQRTGIVAELRLPRAGVTDVDSTAEPAASDIALHGSAVILVAEPDPPLRSVIAALLRDLGYT